MSSPARRTRSDLAWVLVTALLCMVGISLADSPFESDDVAGTWYLTLYHTVTQDGVPPFVEPTACATWGLNEGTSGNLCDGGFYTSPPKNETPFCDLEDTTIGIHESYKSDCHIVIDDFGNLVNVGVKLNKDEKIVYGKFTLTPTGQFTSTQGFQPTHPDYGGSCLATEGGGGQIGYLIADNDLDPTTDPKHAFNACMNLDKKQCSNVQVARWLNGAPDKNSTYFAYWTKISNDQDDDSSDPGGGCFVSH